jgi:hypothetical protein
MRLEKRTDLPRCCVVLLFAVTWPLGALAGPELDEARELLRRMDYGRAMDRAEGVLRAAHSGPEELVEAYRILGLGAAALGRSGEAQTAFRRLLAIEPAFRLPREVSPKLRPPFERALAEAAGQAPIGLEHEPPAVGTSLAGTRLEARVESDPLSMVRGLRFRYLSGPQVKELAVLVGVQRKLSLRLPRGFAGQVFTYWVEALNEHGAVLARLGSQARPLELRALAEQPPPPALASPGDGPGTPAEVEPAWYQSWWFWTVVGAVVVAGAVTGGVLGAQASGEPDPLRWQIEVR